MDRESKYLLHLLGAWLREEEPRVNPDIDWKRLTELARIHNIVGILGYLTMTWPICPEEGLRTFLRGACLNTVSTFTDRAELAMRFSSMLTDSGIDHIVMKGFVLRNFYPVPELRTFGDIDLVIRQKDRDKCHQKMLQQGFTVKTDWEPVFTYKKGREVYEIHSRLMEVDVSENTDCQSYFKDVWAHTRQEEGPRYELMPEYHFLYLLTHLAKHVVSSGAGLRMYLDMGAFIRGCGGELDWKYVEEELEKLALSDFANIVLTFVKESFGIMAPVDLKPVGEQTLRDFTEFTLAGGVFGKAARDAGTDSVKKESRNGRTVSRTGTLMKRLFPSAQTIQERYTYLQKKPWLLPAAWVHRLVITGGSWRDHTREMQDILTADKEMVRKLNRLYREIGL